jgi:hypothetical protein
MFELAVGAGVAKAAEMAMSIGASAYRLIKKLRQKNDYQVASLADYNNAWSFVQTNAAQYDPVPQLTQLVQMYAALSSPERAELLKYLPSEGMTAARYTAPGFTYRHHDEGYDQYGRAWSSDVSVQITGGTTEVWY